MFVYTLNKFIMYEEGSKNVEVTVEATVVCNSISVEVPCDCDDVESYCRTFVKDKIKEFLRSNAQEWSLDEVYVY